MPWRTKRVRRIGPFWLTTTDSTNAGVADPAGQSSASAGSRRRGRLSVRRPRARVELDQASMGDRVVVRNVGEASAFRVSLIQSGRPGREIDRSEVRPLSFVELEAHPGDAPGGRLEIRWATRPGGPQDQTTSLVP